MNPYHRITDFSGSRRKGIGSSDIPTLAGFNKGYKHKYLVKKTGQIEEFEGTPYTLYLEKKGLIEQCESSDRAEWGHRLEPVVIAKWIETVYGPEAALAYYSARIRDRSIGVFKSLTECRMPERRYVIAHADLVIDTPEPMQVYNLEGHAEYVPACIVEAKTTGYYAGKRREGEAFLGYDPDDLSHQGIPDPVFLQAQWQMLAYGVGVAYVPVLIDTGDYREYGPILADPRTQEKCLALAERLWWCVEHDKPPKPETWSDVAKMWPVPEPKTAMLGGDDELRAREYVAEYWRLGAVIKRDEARRDDLKSALGIYLGENQILSTAEGMKLASSWTQSNPASVDLKGLKEKDAELYGRLVAGGYVRTSERRELRPAKIEGI